MLDYNYFTLYSSGFSTPGVNVNHREQRAGEAPSELSIPAQGRRAGRVPARDAGGV